MSPYPVPPRSRLRACTRTLCPLLVAALAVAGAAAGAEVGSGVSEALAASETVRVMIAFGVPGRPTRSPARFMTSAAGRAAIATARNDILASIPVGDFVLRRQFVSVAAMAGEISARGLEELLRHPGVLRVDLDAGGQGHLGQSVPLTNLDDVQIMGYTGVGTTVAVLDSGYDSDHPDLSDDLIDEQCFCSGNGGCCPGGGSTQAGPGSAEDDNGHGTNVSGIVTSKGTVAPTGGAPDADIVAVKVLDAGNSFCCSSDIVAGLDWIAANHPEVAAVNASLGTSARFPGDCDNAAAFTMALATAIDNLRSLGILLFASSGNNGSGVDMGAPACNGNSIAVGAVYDSNFGTNTVFCTEPTAADKVTCFSNSDSATDLFVPGAAITSAGLGGGTSTFLGTSQASPHAAACAALLRQACPGLSADSIEAALEDSPVLVNDPKNGLDFPRLDCLDALRAAGVIFSDGFESGDASVWSSAVP